MVMASLIFLLLQRAGLLLVLGFALTRMPAVRRLLTPRYSWGIAAVDSLIFGALGIFATQFDVQWTTIGVVAHGWVGHLQPDAMLIGPNLVATVIAGLLGGTSVGVAAGLITGAFVYWQGGDIVMANALIHPVAGLFCGLVGRFFAQERVIAPVKALFVGMFVPIMHMSLLLICAQDTPTSIALVNQIGLPLVLTNSLAIAIFTAIIRAALSERDQQAALETQRALRIAEAALPQLRQPLHYETAGKLARLLLEELRIAAVSVTNRQEVLAHIGVGADHHQQGQPLRMQLARTAIESGDIQATSERDVIQCNQPNCPLHSAIMVPIQQAGEVVGLINLFFQRTQPVRSVDMELARGLGHLISKQMDVAAAEKMKQLVQDARLRNLQAQVNPHFLFNTLHMITALIRINPDQARHTVVQLGQFMRHNLRVTAFSKIPLQEEIEHLKAYIEILKMRFDHQLTVHLAVEENTWSARIPPCTLQPLVENCIKHGLTDSRDPWSIEIGICQIGDVVHVHVQDNGCGIPLSTIARLGKQPLADNANSGFGIYSVNQRLLGLFGVTSALHIRNLEPTGCEVSFCIPAMYAKEE